jgi:16S rRNA (uracil1498-N3)-methyltransferase
LRCSRSSRSIRRYPGYLAQALAKGDRDELAIQAATELGVDGIIPWLAARSISRWEGAKIAKGQDRWLAVVREATKQSARAWLPEVQRLTTTKDLAALGELCQLIVLDPLAELSLTQLESPVPRFEDRPDGPPRSIVLVVGPEGGISPAEFFMRQGQWERGSAMASCARALRVRQRSLC